VAITNFPNSPTITGVTPQGDGSVKIDYKEIGNMLPRITEDGVTLAKPWEYYSLNAAGEEVKNLKPDGFTMRTVGTGVVGIMTTLRLADYGLLPKQIVRLSAMSNPKGLKVSMVCKQSDMVTIGSWGVYPASSSDPAVPAGYCEVEIPSSGAEYLYIQISNTTTSPNATDIVISNIDLRVESVATPANKLVLQRRPKGNFSTSSWENVTEITVRSNYTNQMALPFPWTHTATSGEVVEYICDHCLFWSFPATRNTFSQDLTLQTNTTYTLSCKDATSNSQTYVRITDTGGSHTYYFLRDGTKSITFTTPSAFNATTKPILAVNVRDNQETGVANSLIVREIMLNQGSTALPYEPYQTSRMDGSYIDKTASGGDIEYRLVAVNTSTGNTSPGNMVSTTNTFEDTILSNPKNPDDYIVLKYVTARNHSRSRTSSLLRFAGRVNPVREYGVQRSLELSLDWYAAKFSDAVAYEDWFIENGIFLYRDNAGRYFYATADDVTTNDEPVSGFRQSTTITETDYNLS